ncbi:hypothetical protein QM012_008649 [Aureobasidium pullulans]|uniref:EKC/KEOPS complex subunit BUD32 n=1 Tax=Aureobasidium pullulans TaxID=5580 RepID=A0ABR0TK44_AURPU
MDQLDQQIVTGAVYPDDPTGAIERRFPHISIGSTAIIRKYRVDVVVKCPLKDPLDNRVNRYQVEKQIYEILGLHARINRFLGCSEEPLGLLFVEANRGTLQHYIDTQNEAISIDLRLKWRLQAAEAIAYIHSKGVIHSDLRPENILLHAYEENKEPDLLLCDFGGSYCKTSSGIIDGKSLPDSGFFNPRSEWVSTEDTDIFALASNFYTVMTGHWPYRSPGNRFGGTDLMIEYMERVDKLFMDQEFPSVQDLVGGDIIQACWFQEIRDAETIVSRHEQLIHERAESDKRAQSDIDV